MAAINSPVDGELDWGPELRQVIDRINNLDGTSTASISAALATKAASTHTHPISDVANLQSALDTKASVSHTHTGSGTLIVQDEGSNLTPRTKLNFVGTGVSVTDDPTNDRTNVSISGTASVYTGVKSTETYLRGDDSYADPSLLAPPVHSVGNSGSALTINAASTSGWIKIITLTANCVFTLAGAVLGRATRLRLILTQDATGGRKVTWPSSVSWPEGGAPLLSSEPGSIDRIDLTSYDGGTTWIAVLDGRSIGTAPTEPSAPTGVIATAGPAGSGQAKITFTAPESNGGTPITSYEVTASPGGTVTTGSTPPITVSGLVPGASYVFTVRARNSVGVGSAATSGSITIPAAAPAFADTFNRADSATLGTSSSGGAWQEPWTANFQVVSNRARPDSEATSACFTPALASGDHYAELTLAAFTGGISSFVGPIVRAPATLGSSNSATGAFYYMTVSGSGMNTITLRRKDALVSSNTSLASATQAVAAGDVLRLEAQGSTLKGYINGALVVSYTDAALADQTRAGIYVDEGTGALVDVDNFSAGSAAGNVGSTSLLWEAKPEDGGLGGWSYLHSAVPVGIVSAASGAPVRTGTHSFYSELQDGVTIYSTERSEWANGPDNSDNYRFAPGDETYTALSIYLDPTFPSFTHWSLVTQWKGPHEGTPPQQISLSNGKWAIIGSGLVSPRPKLEFADVVKGVWNDFIVHHKWSSDPAIGFVEVWLNGTKVLNKTFMKTQDTTTPLFLSCGQYRDTAPTTGTAKLWLDAVRIGTTYESVAL